MYVKIGGADVIQLHIFNMEMIGEANYDKCDVTRLQSFSLVRDWTAEEVIKWITLKTIFDASTYSPFVIFKIFHFKKCISKIITKWWIVELRCSVSSCIFLWKFMWRSFKKPQLRNYEWKPDFHYVIFCFSLCFIELIEISIIKTLASQGHLRLLTTFFYYFLAI